MRTWQAILNLRPWDVLECRETIDLLDQLLPLDSWSIGRCEVGREGASVGKWIWACQAEGLLSVDEAHAICKAVRTFWL